MPCGLKAPYNHKKYGMLRYMTSKRVERCIQTETKPRLFLRLHNSLWCSFYCRYKSLCCKLNRTTKVAMHSQIFSLIFTTIHQIYKWRKIHSMGIYNLCCTYYLCDEACLRKLNSSMKPSPESGITIQVHSALKPNLNNCHIYVHCWQWLYIRNSSSINKNFFHRDMKKEAAASGTKCVVLRLLWGWKSSCECCRYFSSTWTTLTINIYLQHNKFKWSSFTFRDDVRRRTEYMTLQ